MTRVNSKFCQVTEASTDKILFATSVKGAIFFGMRAVARGPTKAADIRPQNGAAKFPTIIAEGVRLENFRPLPFLRAKLAHLLLILGLQFMKS